MKIGISYSWDDEEHKEWVLALAARLEAAGFEVLYDRGQPLGARLPHFMEQMVSQSQRILVICTAKYKQRFDQRLGGVGYEGHLISGEVVRDHGTVKFIPILRRDSWADAMPLCLDGTLGTDLREGEQYDAQCQKLFTELSATAPQTAPPAWDGLDWTGQLLDDAQVRNALAAIAAEGYRYYRVIEMSPNPKGYEKNNNDLSRALRQAVVWHGEHPWPASIGMLECLLKASPDEEATDLYARKVAHPDGIIYSLRMDHMLRYEYIEARRDCALRIVETEDFHWFRRGQLMFDKAIGSTSDALKFWARFYQTLLGANTVEFKMRWHGLKGLQLSGMDNRFANAARTLIVSPRVCRHDGPVESDRLLASPQNAVGWELDFVKRTTGYLFGQFAYDPSEQLVKKVHAGYHATLSDAPVR